MEENRAYFTRRASQEGSAARKSHGAARIVHRQLAECYRELADTDEKPK